MNKLNVHVFDHSRFMSEVAELLEDILGRPIYEIENWQRLVNEARQELNLMRSTCSHHFYENEQGQFVPATNTLVSPLDK